MPYAPPAVQATIMAKAASLGVVGPNFPQLALAASMGFSASLGTAAVSYLASGVAGPGTIIPAPAAGAVPEAMAASILTQMSARGMAGPQMSSTALAVATGLCGAVPGLLITGMVPGISTGAGSAKLISFDPVAFATTVLAYGGLAGPQGPLFAEALAAGVSLYLISSVVVPAFSIVGPPVPPPPIGPVPVPVLPGVAKLV